MTPQFARILRNHIQNGRLCVHQYTTVTSSNYFSADQKCAITTNPVIDDLPDFDHVYLATGADIDVGKLPMLEALRENHPIQALAGFPTIDDDLKWSADVPLFFTGKLAALQLGPGAANLEGARLGAERIAWSIEESLGSSELLKSESMSREKDDFVDGYIAGSTNKFDALSMRAD